MSTYYVVACHTCKKFKFMPNYTNDSQVQIIGEFVRYEHLGHNISLEADIIQYKDDDLYSKILYEYEEIDIKEEYEEEEEEEEEYDWSDDYHDCGCCRCCGCDC
jgi:hypothetical protein